MTFVVTVALFVMAIAVPVLGQVDDISSDLNSAGRTFSCAGEVVRYACSGQGNTLSIESPPLFNRHTFIIGDTVPDAVPSISDVVITLTNRVTNSSGTFYAANLQVTVPSNPQQMRINVSCSTNVPGPLENFVIPLIRESQSEPPSTVNSFTIVPCKLVTPMASRSVRVSWTPPMNPQFDIDYYLVRIYNKRTLYTTRTSRNDSLEIDIGMLLSEDITVDVRTVTTCGTISAAQQSIHETFDLGCSGFLAAFLVPTIIGLLFFIAVVILAIFLVKARMTISEFRHIDMQTPKFQNNQNDQNDQQGVVKLELSDTTSGP